VKQEVCQFVSLLSAPPLDFLVYGFIVVEIPSNMPK
jgi:hypothetical protein